MADADRGAQRLVCRSYTYARRFPLVIGKLGGWSPLWGPASISQYIVGVATAVVLFHSRGLWAHLGAAGNLAVGVCLPFLLAWMVRRVRVEGRDPLRALVGAAGYAFAPRHGVARGRPAARPRPVRLPAVRVFDHAGGVSST
jgi:hypothetical protein